MVGRRSPRGRDSSVVVPKTQVFVQGLVKRNRFISDSECGLLHGIESLFRITGGQEGGWESERLRRYGVRNSRVLWHGLPDRATVATHDSPIDLPEGGPVGRPARNVRETGPQRAVDRPTTCERVGRTTPMVK